MKKIWRKYEEIWRNIKEYEEIIKKYEDIMKKYKENKKKYEATTPPYMGRGTWKNFDGWGPRTYVEAPIFSKSPDIFSKDYYPNMTSSRERSGGVGENKDMKHVNSEPHLM